MNANLLEKLKEYGVGHRNHDDKLFADDKPPPKYGIQDLDEENLCHEVMKTSCHIFGCSFTGDTLLEFENHYNAAHRFSCAECKKILPSPHLLDLHIQERHDSFFAVMAERKPSFSCYIEECKEKFLNPQERICHCVKVHKLPKDYRFEQTQQKGKKPRMKKNKNPATDEERMEIEHQNMQIEDRHKKFAFTNSKQKVFYSGKKFTSDNKEKNKNVNIDEVMVDLKDSLPC